MKFMSGFEEWWSDLGEIYSTEEVRGIEKAFDLGIFALMIVTPSQFAQFFCGRRDQAPQWFVDVYVGAATVLLMGLLSWNSLPSAIVASYLLASTIIVLLNVIFLRKLNFIGPVASNERSLLLFTLNIAQVLLTFAIWYRWELPYLRVGDAFFKTLLVFGTISYPEGAEIIAGWQIVIDFVLLAVFLAFFVGRLGNNPGRS